jgi:hypothetical protein
VTHRIATSAAASIAAVCVALVAVAEDSTGPLTVPVTFAHHRIMVPAQIAEAKPVSLLLDNGFTIPTVHPALIDELGIAPSGSIRINGIAGEERAPTYRGIVFQIGGATYAPFRVAAVPSERDRRRRRDGVIDAGFFRKFVVEIDPARKVMRLHAPATFVYAGSGQAFPLRFVDEAAVMKASIVLPDGRAVDDEFEVDTGCDSGLCLGSGFVARHNLVDAKGEPSQKFGIGGGVETKSGSVSALRFGTIDVREPQTDFFLRGSPVNDPLAGHIGMGVLHQFKVIFDYSRKVLILEQER